MQGAIANYSHFESMQKGLETFFQDADKGKAKFEELRKMSNETTFGVDELANSFTQLANVGVDVDTIRDKLMMLGDVSQGNKQKFAELVSIYSKIQSTGKAGSEQLQMLAMRGLPIYDILKKIGVQGTATGEDVTKALQEMTKEGGQFHNAMNNINETIEGKQGFLSDYLKEMSVNFAEVTGLADDYKDILDVLNNVVASVSDKFLEWNNNPMTKAILSGVFKASIAGLAGIIVTALVPALIKVLGLIGMFNPVVLLGGLAGAGIGLIVSYFSKMKQEEESVNDLLREQKKLREDIAGIGNLTAGSSPEEISKEKEELESMLATYDKIANYDKNKVDYFSDVSLKRIDNANKLIEKYTNHLKKATEAGDEEKIAEYNSKIDELKAKVKGLTAEYDLLTIAKNKSLSDEAIKQAIADTEDAIEIQKKYEKTLKTIDDNNPYSKQLKEIEELTSQIEDLNNASEAKGIKSVTYKGGLPQYEYDLLININPAYKQKIDEAKEYLEEKLQKVQIDLDFEKADEWRKQIQNILELDKKDVLSGNGKDIVDIYISNRQKQMSAFLNKNTIASELGLNTSDVSKQIVAFAQDSFKQINALLDTGNFYATDKAIVSLKDNINTLRQQFVDMGGSVEEFNLALGKSPEALEKTFTSLSDISTHLMEIANDSANSTGGRIGAMAGAMAINGAQGSKAGDIANGAIQGASIGGPIGALIGAFVALALKTQTFTDSLEDLNGIIDPLIIAVNAILKPLTSLAKVIINVLSPILEGLATVIENVFNFFFGWLNNHADSTREATKAKEDELAQIKSSTQSYQDLLNAIREQEEYYIRKKAELNMFALDDKVTKVNDMILTPNGRFSTHPDDYLIATKNPQGLGSGKVINNIKIINNAGVEVQTSQRQNNGINEMMITISRKIASDVAEGVNGWDNAFAIQQQRYLGRRI